MPGLREGEPVSVGADLLLTSDGVVTRFYAPAPDLAPFVIDYTIHDSGPAYSQERINHYLPGPANVCLTFDAGPIRARIRNFRREWTSDSMVFGPTSIGMEIASNGGRLIGFGLTPLGWSRLFRRSAKAMANRIEPWRPGGDEAGVIRLRRALAAADDDAAIAATLDDFLREHIGVPTTDDALIAVLTTALLDPAIEDVAQVAARVGASADAIRRVANRYFGFPVKLLLRRNRFVRALMAMDRTNISPADFAAIAPGYHDRSHFIRDAQLFLGMTGRQFLRDITPLMEAMRRGRRARFGQPLQGLIAPGRDNLIVPAASAA